MRIASASKGLEYVKLKKKKITEQNIENEEKSYNGPFVTNHLHFLGSMGTGTSRTIGALLIYVAAFQYAFSLANTRPKGFGSCIAGTEPKRAAAQ